MRKWLLQICLLFTVIHAAAQSDTAFWFAAPDVSSAFNYDRPIFIRLTAGQQPCVVSISQPAGGGLPIQNFTLAANSTQSVDLTAWLNNVECGPGNIIQNKGIKITSTNKIAAYYEVNANGPNPEIFAMKGKNALGTQFYISSQYLLDNTAVHVPTPLSSFNIVASEDNTSVTITPTNNITGHLANIPFSFTLNKGQTYAAIATSTSAALHLQGSKVTATKPVAITLADDLLQGTAYGGPCEDLAGDQTVPVEVTGTEYIAFKSYLNSPFDKVYITATQNGTAVNQDGVFITTLNAGQSIQLSVTNNTTYINTSAQAYAYQLSGIVCEVGSAILPKINCTGSSAVSVVRSSNENFYITLLVKNGGQNNFLINGVAGVVTAAQFNVVPGTTGVWFGAKIQLPITNYPNNSVIRVNNTSSIFQMGILEGGTASGAAFGYFSDFNSLTADAFSPDTIICAGTTLHLFADSIVSASYSWIGPSGFSSNSQNPSVSNATVLNSGNYIVTVNVPGCGNYLDTIRINVKPKSFSSINQTICQGQTFLGHNATGVYTDTLVAANGCDSVRTLTLTVKPKSFSSISQTICEGQTFLGHSSTGIYNDTLVAVNGCDSVRTLTLTVKPRSFSAITQSICQGQTYLGYNATGIYKDTLIAANGCDSVRTLNLTVKPKSFSTINQSICQGQTYLGYSATGIYKDTLVAANGCDSIRTLNLTVKPKSFSSISQTICQGQTFLGHNATGVYTDTLVAANGCDSVRTLTLTVKPKSFSSISQTICEGQTFLGHSSTGIYKDTVVAANGCDSIRTLTLTVKPISFSTITQSICQGQTYLGHSATGIYQDTLVSASGCDSIRTVNLTVNQNPDPKLGPDLQLCLGDSLIISPGVFNTYLWQDGSSLDHFVISKSGLYSVTVSNGCGSASDNIVISSSQCNIYFPNSFTPNNDGKNDFFNILNAHNLQDYYLTIYNRWGEKVFETNNYTVGWNGFYKELPANPDVYVWYCQFKTLNAIRKMKGNVILIR